MSVQENQSTKKLVKDFTRTWRYKIGLSLIVFGNLALVIGLLLPLFGLAAGGKAALVGVLIIGGELVSLLSIVFLGMEGFKAIKYKIFGIVRSGFVAPHGPVRHYIGIVLLFIDAMTKYIMVLYAWYLFGEATLEDQFPETWGLSLAEQESLVFWLVLTGELCFLGAIYVLGADWWGKFRDLFIWKNPNLGEGSKRSRQSSY